MKKAIAVFLLGVTFISLPVQARANKLNYIIPEEVDGIPLDVRETAEIVGHELGICPELLEAIAYRESRFSATAINGSCKGLMQLNSCHDQRFRDAGWSPSDWENTYKNMYVAGVYLKELFDEYEDVGIVLGLYHGESDAISRGQSGKLSSYTNEILEHSEKLERAHGK